jgi:acetyltransferase-like isoleucine patch superfamily enzyme
VDTRHSPPEPVQKSWLRRSLNRLLHSLARACPGAVTVRPFLHRLRGVKIHGRVFIGDEVYLDNEYPDAIEIHDQVQISIRAVVIAHTRGAGRVIIERAAFVGPHVVIASSAGRTIRIGEGAVISAGCVVTRSIVPHSVVAPAPLKVLGSATVPLTTVGAMEEFHQGLVPLRQRVPESS